jgi:hypothetical protein
MKNDDRSISVNFTTALSKWHPSTSHGIFVGFKESGITDLPVRENLPVLYTGITC